MCLHHNARLRIMAVWTAMVLLTPQDRSPPAFQEVSHLEFSSPLDSGRGSLRCDTTVLRILMEFLSHLMVLSGPYYGASSFAPNGPLVGPLARRSPCCMKGNLWIPVMIASLKRSIPSSISPDGPGNSSVVLQSTLLPLALKVKFNRFALFGTSHRWPLCSPVDL